MLNGFVIFYGFVSFVFSHNIQEEDVIDEIGTYLFEVEEKMWLGINKKIVVRKNRLVVL